MHSCSPEFRRVPRRMFAPVLVAVCLSTFGDPATVSAADAVAPRKIDYNRDIRPILSNACLKCHGPDAQERQAKLRLDDRDAALAPAESGAHAIVPGQPDKSELIARVFSKDDTFVMPPPEANKKLTPEQQDLLKRWIEQGAEYQQHWSLKAPRRPALPAVAQTAWPRNPIDHFILARLEKEGLPPSPEADKATLIRRLTLDLTGLPPTPAELDAFVADQSAEAYDRVVDRLLSSPHYGERLALEWLDAARYADTHGYHIDSGRDMTLWRSWVIDAFNKNLPFDQFTVQQLAGDLLPEASTPQATVQQRIASGFHRNHMINYEGGAIPKEYHTAYIVDRVNTTATVWMGLTVACSQCHDHKFDPITQKEYYQLYAFFHNVPENGLDGKVGNAVPMLKLPTPEQQQAADRLTASIKSLEQKLADPNADVDLAQAEWEKASTGGEKLVATAEPPATNSQQPKMPDKTKAILALAADKRTKAQVADLKTYYRTLVSPVLKPVNDELVKLRKAQVDLDRAIPSPMVMEEMPQPRDTFLLVRGQYDKQGDKVTAGVPASLPPLPSGAPANRLGLAQWLVAPTHPLTSRVTVNRYWQMLFGNGLVKTADDFGSQGEAPSHPELLDWLALEFMSPTVPSSQNPTLTAWNIKALLKLIVTSAMYRQSANVTPALLAKDPENRLLGRGVRLRLPAEFIRDQALFVSGLLDRRIGGHSVSPYQPAGLWEELMARQDNDRFTAQVYVQSHGPDLYRRTMYTFWKRTVPPPTLVTFDAPDRETCTVRRARTNTHLQALVLMNDPTYVEASRKLAERILLEGGQTLENRIAFAFRLTLARRPSDGELQLLRKLFDDQLAKYRQNESLVNKLLSVGESPVNDKLDKAELAAWTMLGSVILNLDETVTKG